MTLCFRTTTINRFFLYNFFYIYFLQELKPIGPFGRLQQVGISERLHSMKEATNELYEEASPLSSSPIFAAVRVATWGNRQSARPDDAEKVGCGAAALRRWSTKWGVEESERDAVTDEEGDRSGWMDGRTPWAAQAQ